MLLPQPHFSLLQILQNIQSTIKQNFNSGYWVIAEMNKLNYYSHSGHCYPELVEKKDSKIVAQMRAIIWKNDFLNISNKFKTLVKENLKDGIKILFYCTINFDPLYGFSLRIIDINPQFSIGDLEHEKKVTIAQLKSLNYYDENKKKILPLVPKRWAIISVETSKGFQDFKTIIESYKHKYNIEYFLFPAILQGEGAIIEIKHQLQKILKLKDAFDGIAIIRGGGGDIGLSCYNHFELCQEICLSSLPVFTGIGHAANDTVAEQVAYYSAITPTKLAEFIVSKFLDYESGFMNAIDSICKHVPAQLNNSKEQLNRYRHQLNFQVKNKFALATQNLNYSLQKINANSQFQIKNKATNIENLIYSIKIYSTHQIKNNLIQIKNWKDTIHLLDPIHIMKRGFSIVKQNNKLIKNVDELYENSIIETQFYNGKILSQIKKIQPNE